jgi:hypothetical protein
MDYEDRICKIYNELIPFIIPDYKKRSKNLINVEMTAGYKTLHMHYIFNYIPSIKVGSSLHCQILFTFDKFLSWCDLTEFGNNKVILHIHNVSTNTIEKLTYFELMNITSTLYPTRYMEHPKLSQFLLWKENEEKYYEYKRNLEQYESDNLDRIRQSQILLRDL